MEPVTLLDTAPLDLTAWRSELMLALAVALGLLVPGGRPQVRWALTLGGLALAVGLALPPWPAGPVAPLGPHLLVDGLTVASRLVVLLLALASVAGWPASRGASAPSLALSALGLLLMIEAVSMPALLLGCVLVGVGAVQVRQACGFPVAAAHALVGQGFAIAAFAGVLWCGLGGSVDLAAAREGLAARPSLPGGAVPLVLGLLLLGLALSCLAPLRGAGERDDRLGVWFATAPLVALATVPYRLLMPMPLVPTLTGAPVAMMVLGGVLAIAALVAALGQHDPRRRLLTAAPGLLGLAWLGYANVVPDDAVTAAVTGLLAAVLALAAALLLLPRVNRSWTWRLGVTVALLGLASVPPLVSWRPRFALIEALLVSDALLACGLVSLATLLGLMVFLQPAAELWRAGRDEPEAVHDNPAGTVLAWVLLLIVVAWGLGWWPAWSFAA